MSDQTVKIGPDTCSKPTPNQNISITMVLVLTCCFEAFLHSSGSASCFEALLTMQCKVSTSTLTSRNLDGAAESSWRCKCRSWSTVKCAGSGCSPAGGGEEGALATNVMMD